MFGASPRSRACGKFWCCTRRRSTPICCARGADGTWPERPEAIGQDDLILDSIGYTGSLAAFYRSTRLAQAIPARS
jgi:hypothetical protein